MDMQRLSQALKAAHAAGDTAAATKLAQEIRKLQQQSQKPADTSIGTAFNLGDLDTQIAGREGAAALNRLASNSFLGDMVRTGQKYIGNPVRELFNQDPIDFDKVNRDFEQNALTQADNLRAERERLAEETNFKNLTTDDINSIPSFVNFVTQKAAMSAPRMAASIGSFGYATYPFSVGNLTEAQKDIDGLSQEQKDKASALGGVVLTALENLGLAKLLPNGISNGIIGGIASGAITEGATEGLQELVTIGVESNAGKKFTQEEILDRLKESVAAGSAAGGAFKGAIDTGSKFKSAFSKDGTVVNPDDLNDVEKQAAGDLARRFKTTAEANKFNLKNINKTDTKGARATVDMVHVQLTEDLRQRFKDMRSVIKPNDADTFESVRDKILVQAAYREGRNKSKNTVGQQEIDALVRLSGNTREGQEALNILRQLNQLTELHNEGYQGSLSAFTDQFSIFGSKVGYDRGAVAFERIARPMLSGGAAFSTGGASLPLQVGISNTGRAIDKLRGNYSQIDKFVRQNQDNQGLQPPTAPSIRDTQAAQLAAEQQAQLDADQRKEALKAARRDANLDLVRAGADPTPESPQDIMQMATGLDRSGVAKVLRLIQATTENQAVLKAIEDYRESVAVGRKVDDKMLSPLIRMVNQKIKENPDYVERVREPVRYNEPNVQTDMPTMGGGGSQFGEQLTTPENYRRGIQDNLDFVRTLQDSAGKDKKVSKVDRGRLITSLENLTNNLGSNPVETVQTEVQKLQDQGVNQDAIDKYVQPYVDRVARQQRPKPRLSMEPPEDQPTVPELWTTPPQAYDSAATSINKNKNPAGYTKLKKQGVFKEGQTVVDIGGGRFDNVVDELAKEGVTVKIYDPFNRTPEHNARVASEVSDGKADVAVSNNTLNVIQEPENINRVIRQAHNAIPTGAKAYFTVYEGARDSVGKETTQGYQRNEPVTSYIPRLEQVFGKGNVERKGDLLIATKESLPVRFNEQSPILSDRALGSENTISTRFPTQAASQEDPIKDRLIVDTESMKATPAAFEHNMDLVTEYVNFPTADVQNKDPDAIADTFKEHIISNLLFLHDQVPQEIRDRSKKWYDGARKITTKWSEKYNVPDTGIAGALAALSPQKDWYQNVSLAERVLDVMTGKMDTLWTETMNETAAKIFGKPQYAEDLVEIQGKTLKDVMDMDDNHLAAMWIRTFDEAHNDRRYRTVSSEGDFIGEPSGVAAWGSLNEIGKAVAVIRDPSYANVSPQMGARHKVRNFYNNIISPNNNKGDVTIDTHAVAAALLRALSGNSTEVVHNFGTSLPKAKQPEGYRAAKASGIMGSQGLYGLYADAYREAAAQRGIKPRELQSITWEAVRGLFPAKWKQQKNNVESVNNVWSRHKNGDITLDQARKQILDLAGGIDDPTWYDRSNGTKDVETRDSSYEGELDRPSVAGDASGMDSGTRGGNTRLSQEPTGSAGILFRNASQSAASRRPRSDDRNIVPNTSEVKQAAKPVKALIEIGSPNGEFPDGIKDIEGVRRLAEATNITINMYLDQDRLIKDMGFDPTEVRALGAYGGGVANVLKEGSARKNQYGETLGYVDSFEEYITTLHEVFHGVNDQLYNPEFLAKMDSETRPKFEGSIIQAVDMGKNKVTGRKEIVTKGSFDAFIAGLTTGKTKVPNNIRKKMLAEMLDLQKNGYFRSQRGSVREIRNRRAMETNPQFKKYVRNAPETAVDVIMYYAHDPKRMKREYPNLAKMVKAFFSQSSKVQFFSHPLAMAIAVVYAMLLKQEQAEEEELQQGILAQRAMQAGALTA